jgi:hypothetical protein
MTTSNPTSAKVAIEIKAGLPLALMAIAGF